MLPNWLGDTVMATPALRVLRQKFPQTHIAYLGRSGPLAVLADAPWSDATIELPASGTGEYRRQFFPLVRRLIRERFDCALLMPNSFSSALLVCLARIPQRIGYDRDGRGVFLTDRLLPAKDNGRFVPSPMIRYYLALAGYLGASQLDTAMELFTSPADETALDRLLPEWGLDSDHGVLLLHPGGGFGPSKRWPPERFARVADILSERFDLAVAISAGPSERDVAQAVQDSMSRPSVNLARQNISIGQLKVLVRRSRLLISNDTGPRHFAVAFGVPVVTIFGSTDPAWTDTFFDGERIVRAEVDCGPCQKKTCKQDHRCMELVTPDMVLAPAVELLEHYPQRKT
ncbi:MAG: lipopolysaccharide heptosyltransferase II [Actinobacteria bacterium]|nr:lipopolysaccharide heptosyltransferase II [Actinomycetota bacterium]